jgi:heavy metal sensor kinase
MTAVSLRVRLTAWYTAALTIVLLAAAADVLWQQQRIGIRRTDRELASLAETVSNVLQDELRESSAHPAQEVLTTLGLHDRAVAIFAGRDQPLAASWDGLAPSTPPDLPVDASAAWTDDTRATGWRVHAARRRIEGTLYTVLTAAPLTDLARERRELLEAMAVGIPAAGLLAALAGFWLASIGLRPITEMATRAAHIAPSGEEDLGRSDRDDEIGQLTAAFNGLVARLRGALQMQRRFMADASHELRTPVSVIRSAADVTLARDHRCEEEYREALGIVDAEARRAARLVDDMLVLARADAGGYPLQPEPLYLNELVDDCTRALTVLAQERQVQIETAPHGDTSIHGDEGLLRRMLVNVIQNAVQHSSGDRPVVVDIVPNGRHVAVEVTNTGAVIADADRDRIFDRFVQLDAARRGSGSGLGLPIARWIAEAHGGTVMLKASSARATTFSITLPVSES